MRMVHPALMSLLLASAIPSVAFAQAFLAKSHLRHDLHLDHVVPVATLSRLLAALAHIEPGNEVEGVCSHNVDELDSS